MLIYFFLGKVSKNIFTSFGSSMTVPREAYFEEISVNLPMKVSILSLSFILSLSKSAISVWSRASRTLSAPTCLT